MPESALHFTAFMVGFLVFSSLHIVVGEQVPKTLAIRGPEPVVAVDPLIRCVICHSCCSIRSTGCSTARRAPSCGCSACKEARHAEILTDVEIEGLVGDLDGARQDGGRPG